MKPWNSKTLADTPDITVTPDHINRAIKALVAHCPDNQPEAVDLNAVMVGGTLLACMETFDTLNANRWMLVSVLHEYLGDHLPDWVIKTFGFTHPNDQHHEKARREREERRLASLEQAKATRAAKRAAEIEAEVQKRLAETA